MEQESSVELGITVDRLSSDFNYIASNLRFEQSVGNDLLVQISMIPVIQKTPKESWTTID